MKSADLGDKVLSQGLQKLSKCHGVYLSTWETFWSKHFTEVFLAHVHLPKGRKIFQDDVWKTIGQYV